MATALAKISKATRNQARRPKAYGDPVASVFAAREVKRITHLAHEAVAMASAERKRHGREPSHEDRADAAQDVLAAIYAGDAPSFEKLSDQHGRPDPLLVANAGASLDRLYRAREVLIDPMAGSGSLIEQSALQRRDKAAKRSIATQLLDPTASPVPPEVAHSISVAGIWADDPIRQAILDAVVPDLTAEDWAEAGEKGTAAAIWKRRQRAKGTLEVDPRARRFAANLEHEIEPTEAECAAREVLPALIEANPYGAKPKAESLRDPAWRTAQPYATPIAERKLAQ